MKSRAAEEDETDRVLRLVTGLVTIPVISALLLQEGITRNRVTILQDIKRGRLRAAQVTERFHVTTLPEARRYVAYCIAERDARRTRQRTDSPTTALYLRRYGSEVAA